MTREWCAPIDGGVRLSLQILPNAKKTAVAGVMDEALKIRLQAPPVDGKANEALIRFLAELLNVPRSAVKLTHGQSARRKTIEISSAALNAASVRQRLLDAAQL